MRARVSKLAEKGILSFKRQAGHERVLPEALAADSLLSSAMIVFGHAQAMEIRQFDKMAAQDRHDYHDYIELVAGAPESLN
jgi:hypothetical protein